MDKIDPKKLGLPPRTVLYQISANAFVIRIDRKSRIVMKDARKLLQKVKIIQKTDPDVMVGIETTAPVCSKSMAFLNESGIQIHTLASFE